MARKKKEKYITLRVSKAGSESYEVCIRHKSGQTYRKSFCVNEFDSKAQCLECAKMERDKKLAEMNAGFTVRTKKTVHDMYIKMHELYPVRIATRTKHDMYYRNAISKYGDTPITDITPADITTCINEYAKNHSRKETNGLLSVWRTIFKTCAQENICIPDRTAGVRIPECKEAKAIIKAITNEDYKRFIEALLDYNCTSVSDSYMTHSLYYACEIMRYGGLRPAECFALTRDDIDLITGHIIINKALHSTLDSALEIGKVKTETSKRRVPIPTELKPILAEVLNRTVNSFLFTDIHGNVISTETANNLITRVKRVNPDSGLKFNMYVLRHQFSTDLNNSGIPLNVIRDLMGHKNASMTVAYATSSDSDRTEAINSRKFS